MATSNTTSSGSVYTSSSAPNWKYSYASTKPYPISGVASTYSYFNSSIVCCPVCGSVLDKYIHHNKFLFYYCSHCGINFINFGENEADLLEELSDMFKEEYK